MPGRQAHGRPVGRGSGKDKRAQNIQKGPKSSVRPKQQQQSRPNTKVSKKSLNAFAIASEEHADRPKQTPRNRELDAPLDAGKKHSRRDDSDDDEDYDEDEGPPRKMRRGARPGRGGDSDVEYGSDDSGNEWRVGVDDDDESEIDSDEAFGDSDEERFEDYAFRGSRKKQEEADSEEDEDEDIDDVDGASLGSDAIDLADALDMSMSEDDGPPGAEQEKDDSGESESASEESGSGDEPSDESSDVEDDDDDDDGEASESEINAWVSQFSGAKDTNEEDSTTTSAKPKLSLKDLGLLGVKDPDLKKSLKLMTKEEKSTKPQKLAVPLARRQQAQIDRSAAYEKTNQTLDRWKETVKNNRRAEHLVFPLPQNATGLARHDNTEIKPLDKKSAGNELEDTILSIMEESGLGPAAKKETQDLAEADSIDGQGLSRNDRKVMWQEKRRERELKSREDARAKRIKKIKSKAYHRVHRKQREKDEMNEREAMAAAGELDSEDEREAQDRQRAMERMGSRHRESKWAKMSNRNGRAAWDDDVRAGVTDMARRDEELRRRIEGKPARLTGQDDEDDSDYSGDSEDADDRKRLLQQLQDVEGAEDSAPRSKLMNMAFMQKAEAAKRKANDEMVAQIRRDLASGDEEQDDSDDGPEDVGRRKFGQPSAKLPGKSNEKKRAETTRDGKTDEASLQAARDNIASTRTSKSKGLSASAPEIESIDSTAGAWSQPGASGPSSRKNRGKKGGIGAADVLELGSDAVAVAPAAVPSKARKPNSNGAGTTVDYSSDDEDSHLPIQFREQDLIERAFGGMDVLADFEAEKNAVVEEDADKLIDNTLPGWGSWVGEGVSNRDKKRHTGRFLTKREGIKQSDRKDAKLKNVIINEKRNKKNDKYLASQLPHPFESRLQYERSLRLPVGPEWMTKETFQEATKPRVLLKQGIIAPIAKPTH
ncbi:small-subunit processome [Xylariomycetidae sp. FL2044]|nr:small-subunit processome [Xylariomycetidae sp. FL2044]